MNVREAKAELVRAHREGGNVLKASLEFTRAKRKAKRFSKCRICGQTILALAEYCNTHYNLRRHGANALQAV